MQNSISLLTASSSLRKRGWRYIEFTRCIAGFSKYDGSNGFIVTIEYKLPCVLYSVETIAAKGSKFIPPAEKSKLSLF